VKKALAKHVPSKHNQAALFASVSEITATFEEVLVDMGLVEEATQLSTFVDEQGSVQATSNRREQILQEARDILCNDNHNTVQVRHDTERGGLFPEDEESDAIGDPGLKESLFRLPTCHISIPTQSLVDMAYRTLDDMSELKSNDAITTFYGVRDIFDLFRAVVPLKNKDSLSEVPGMSAIFHNDCFYIAHHLLTLGHQFRHGLPEDFQMAATFVDMVPVFQEMGEQCFLAMLRKQRQRLLESIASAEGFDATDNKEKYNKVGKAVDQVLHQLQRLSNVWKNALPVPVFERSMGMLLDTVLTGMMDEVRALEDIRETETHELNSLFMRVKEGIPPLFGVSSLEAIPQDHVKQATRFVQVGDIFEARLRDIVQQWKAQELALSAEELRGFIRALFGNSDMRAKCLAEIK